MKTKLLKAFLSAAIVLLSYLATANATLTLTLADDAGNVGTGTIVQPGTIEFSGSVGAWEVNVVIGQSQPVIGSAAQPEMDLDYMDRYSGSGTSPGNKLTITLTDDGFNPLANVAATASIGGTQSGNSSTTFTSSVNGVPLTSSGKMLVSPYSGRFNATVTNFSGSLTEQVVLVSSNATTDFTSDANLFIGPLPSIGPASGQSMTTNGFALTLQNSVGFNCLIQASTDLTNWLTLTNIPNTSSNIQFLDTNAVNLPHRYYRAVAQ